MYQINKSNHYERLGSLPLLCVYLYAKVFINVYERPMMMMIMMPLSHPIHDEEWGEREN